MHLLSNTSFHVTTTREWAPRNLSDLTPQNDFSNQNYTTIHSQNANKTIFWKHIEESMRKKRIQIIFFRISRTDVLLRVKCVASLRKIFLRSPHIFLFIVKKAVQFAFFTTGNTLSITVPFVIGFLWLFGACFPNTNSLRCGRHDARNQMRK